MMINDKNEDRYPKGVSLKPKEGKGKEGEATPVSICHTDYRHNTWIPCPVRDWKELPLEAGQSPSLGTFISRVSSYTQ